MKLLLDIQKKLLPDLLDVLGVRFRILRFIRLMQPIGRRSLATNLGMSERVLRSEVTFLKEQGLINMATSGMTLTDEGKSVLTKLEEIMSDIFNLKNVENQLKQCLGLSEVIVVPGDSDAAPWVKNEMGRATVQLMKRTLAGETSKIVALTGGTSMAAVAEMMTPDSEMKETLFIPARGGLGEQVENQANTICATMARKADGHYRLLHVPDQLSQDSYTSLMEEPKIKEILALIRSANLVVHGIGEATIMAERRSSSEEILQNLNKKQAVAEAFGYYFNQNGDIIHRVLTIGLQLEDVVHIKSVVAVAGGASKAQAISAFMKQKTSNILVTDEGAAEAILQMHS
ncbi:MAG: sugar-binding transcriptional regulator [Anaerobacillus sp.]|uniref:sugar-binding transcriptional regulator n=1 Tax=Anaerobacillus sp. TaxID=1872506 RepID=UPI00391C0997